MLDHALQYAGRGWRVFPVHSPVPEGCSCGKAACPDIAKHPRTRRGVKDATTDQSQIEAWWTRWPDANIGVATGSGICCIDLDGADEIARLAAVVAPYGSLPRTLTARTGRGYHLYVNAFWAGSRKIDGLLFRGEGGYVIAPPSRHASGAIYQWVQDVPPTILPEWFRTWMETTGGTRLTPLDRPALLELGPKPDYLVRKSDQRVTAPFAIIEETGAETGAPSIADRAAEALREPLTAHNHARVASALAALPASCARDPWLHVGMALHSTGWRRGDLDIGLALWDAWSSTCPEKYSRADVETRWRSFGKPGRGGIGLGTLFHMAETAGWRGLVDFPAAKVASANGNHHPLPSALLEASESAGSTNPVIRLNQQYAVIGDVGGKCLVLGFVPSKVDETVRVPSFQSFHAFRERYANQYVAVESGEGEDRETEYKQLGDFWLRHRQRRTFDGIDLTPGAPEVLPGGVLNLWSGFAAKPVPGDWSRMKAHICNVLAKGEPDSADYILRWAAWAVQHPGERAEVALVFRGDKGTGKGTFANALKRIFGQHGLQIFNPKHLVGAFNGHLRNCLLLYADEAFWAGDKQGESVLKGMLTEPALMIEQKGIDAAPWRNRLHVIMTANAEWVVPASHDERRYAVFDVDNAQLGKEDYFKPLWAEIQNGGLAAMLHDLLKVELGDWHPRRIVQTDALRDQKARSMTGLAEWYEGLLQDAILPYANKEQPDIAGAQYLLGQCREQVPKLRDISGTALGRFLKAQGCVKLHKANGNAWRFPGLLEARAKWESRYKSWRWEHDAGAWQVRN